MGSVTRSDRWRVARDVLIWAAGLVFVSGLLYHALRSLL